MSLQRYRISVRGDTPRRVELRGYVDGMANVKRLADVLRDDPWFGDLPGVMVVASPADDDYDPFAEPAPLPDAPAGTPPGDPAYDGFRITALWAWTMVGADNQEAIIGAPIGPGGSILPLVAADRVRLDSIRRWAEIAAGQHGRPVTLRRFVLAGEDVDVVRP